MYETPVSLLERIRSGGGDSSWARLDDVFQPMIRRWLAQAGIAPSDVDDISQEVMIITLKKLPEFERQRTGSFRAWLRNVTVNCLRDFRKSARRKPLATDHTHFDQVIAELAAADSGLSRLWNAEHDQNLLRYLLKQVRAQFAQATLKAFTRVVLDERSPDEVAAELGMTVNAVFIAKSRVLAKLRETGAGLIE